MDQSKPNTSTTIDTEPESASKTPTTASRVLLIGSSSVTAGLDSEAVPEDAGYVLWLRLGANQVPPVPVRRVCFHEGVIDNEHLNRRKSKCCCIYRKPHAFDESSSSTDDECEHCFGHPEVRTRNRLEKQRRRQTACSCCICGGTGPHPVHQEGVEHQRDIDKQPEENDRQEVKVESPAEPVQEQSPVPSQS